MDTKALRQKVLDLAIRGKLVPQNPNDEPASVLLERIRQQKQQMVKEGKLKAKDIKNDSTIFVGEDNLHYEKFADGSVKCIEDEIPFDLPGGWAWARVNQIYNFIDYRGATPNKISSGVPLITAKNVKSGYIDYTIDEYISEEEYWDRQQRGTSHLGDILFTTEAPLGNAAIADFEKFSAGQRLITFQHYGGCVLNNHTFLYFILSDFFQSQLHTRKTGSTVAGIKAAILKTLLLPVPPIAEQAKIGAKCESLLTLIEEIANSRQDIISAISRAKAKILDLAIRGQLVPQNLSDEPASALLERIRAEKEALIQQGKIKRAKKESIIFRGEDNSYYAMIDGVSIDIAEYLGYDLPDGWIWITLKDIATITSGKTPKPDQLSTNGTVPYFKIADMNTPGNELYLRHTDCYINDLYSGPVYDDGSFVFPKNGGAVLTNKKRILTNTSVVDLNTGVFTPSKLLNQDYIFFLFSSIDFSKIHKGAVIPTVDSTVIGNLIYGLPPIEEQKRIANIIKNLFAQVDQIEIALS